MIIVGRFLYVHILAYLSRRFSLYERELCAISDSVSRKSGDGKQLEFVPVLMARPFKKVCDIPLVGD